MTHVSSYMRYPVKNRRVCNCQRLRDPQALAATTCACRWSQSRSKFPDDPIPCRHSTRLSLLFEDPQPLAPFPFSGDIRQPCLAPPIHQPRGSRKLKKGAGMALFPLPQPRTACSIVVLVRRSYGPIKSPATALQPRQNFAPVPPAPQPLSSRRRVSKHRSKSEERGCGVACGVSG